ncbi:zinc-binding dehydrogenase [Lederbergia sp. NSJ-179]|uniref:zinc-binding dehydrogenase n=1 Tax=Bacillaceae TaxID=186817 RepID=UPI001A972C05|nr:MULTISPECIES: zinc-binding dehydrogenase [Bacillaceae]MBO0992718.1 zinc-binding dehydrogenase [Bacillus sp. SD088]MCJ7842496.1 zinc-binding dehydrogenase [Lederbergia sp. NSJ-179]
MKAALITENGSLDKVVIGEHPKPEVGADDVIVKVKAVSLNHLDIFVRRGMPGQRKKPPFPHISGGDVAGFIDTIGENVEGLQVGDRVLIDPKIAGYGALGEDLQGGLAEFVKVPAVNIIPLPENISFEDAAALPIAYGTAWKMLINRGELKANETVLILGASGGVGNALVQIAKIAGANIIAAAGSEEKLEKLKELGADHVINYNEEDFSRKTWQITKKQGADVVVDYTGEATWPKSILATKKRGRILTCGATTGFNAVTDLRYVWKREISIIGSTSWERRDLEILLELVESGKLKPIIDRILPLEEAREAHRLMEEREIFGKLILQP